MKNPVKVFLVEDSPVASTILQRILTSSSEIEIVGTANNGIDALKQIPLQKPDVVCTDLLMEKMDGLELTKQLMARFPRPILVISDVVTNNNTHKIGQLLEAGVVDVFPKPKTGFIQDYEKQTNSLIQKIIILAGVKVFTKKKYIDSQQINSDNINRQALSNTNIKERKQPKKINYKIIAIGVSTGGPKALETIFSQLPADFPLAIVCTQHISVGFLSSLISWLSQKSNLTIKIAEYGEKPLPGIIYFAPENYHLAIDNQGNFSYLNSFDTDIHCPSVNTMFQSFAQFYNQSMIGILLTGMGKDGAIGMQEIYKFGGLTIAQDESSSIIFGMPYEAIKLGVVTHTLPLTKISSFLIDTINS